MALRHEGEERSELEHHVERLERTLREVAQETGSVKLHGPCESCGRCLTFRKNGQLFCPHCGEGQNL